MTTGGRLVRIWFSIATLAACSSAPAASVRPERGGEAAESKDVPEDAAGPAAPDASPPRELAYPPLGFTAPRTAKLGKATLTITPCRLDVPIVADTRVAKQAGGLAVDADGRVYILDAGGTVRRYTLVDPCDLRVDDSFAPAVIPAEQLTTSLSVDAAGVLYVDRFNQKPMRIEPSGAQEEICSFSDNVRTEPGAEVTVVEGRAVTSLKGSCEGPDITFEGWKGYSPDAVWPFAGDLAVVNYIGDSVPIDYHRVGIHTIDGKKKVFVGKEKDGPERICGTSVIWPCGDEICLGDWGCSTLRVWTVKGTLAGIVESPELVGIVDARPIDAVAVGGASLMLLGASVRDSETWTYYPLIVRIEGL
jgi:hypothetical protein